MWAVIADISTWTTLVAFLAATAAWAFKAYSERNERLILNAETEHQAKLAEKIISKTIEYIDDLEINTLTKEQRYNLALEQIHNRANRFKITSIVICFIAATSLAFTAYAMNAAKKETQTNNTQPDNEIRFDVKLDDIKFFKIGDKIRTQVTLQANSLTKNNNESATIFTGMITAHNEELFDAERDASYPTCKEATSCLYTKVFKEFLKNPIVIRGGDSTPSNITTIFDIPENVKLIRLSWTFYQKEANNRMSCTINTNKPPPIEGIPFLKVVTSNGADRADGCWKSADRTIKPVIL